jgi:serine/threonine-protein kinase
MIGEMIGSFKVLSQIGQGGMGAVYLAEHPLIGRKVAIKVILPEHCHQKDTLNRFLNEARATARLRHPSLVDTIDFGTHNGSAFIIMEYLEGETLGDRLKHVPLMPAWEVARIARQIAEAVGVAHAAMIVHRDLKPDNVFLVPHPSTGDDLVKILDFGIAKLTGADDGGTHTRTGVMVGTPLFMAPEQCRGAGTVDLRADIYSLGCIMYRMLCGRPPFAHSGIGELIAAHLYEVPASLRSMIPTIPEAMEAVVTRAMAKRPEDRYQSMAELITDLDAAHASLTSAAYSAAGGSTMVLSADAVPKTPLPPMSSRTPLPPGTPYPGGTVSAGRPNPTTASAPGRSPAAPPAAAPKPVFMGPTQVLPTVTEEQSQRLRKTTFSGSTGVVADEPSTGKRKSKVPVIAMAAAAIAILVGVGIGVGGHKQPRPSAAVPVAVEPVRPAPPLPPAPEPAPAPAPPPAAAAEPPRPAEKPAKPAEPAHHVADARPAVASSHTRIIRITVSNAPEALAVLVDGRPGRLPVRLPADNKPHTLRFESTRTRPETRTITADKDQAIELSNKPKLLLD